MTSKELEDRLVDFSVLVISICETLTNKSQSKIISGQILRSALSSALNYGEAQSAESRKDFLHKIKIVQKELRESMIALKIIKKAGLSMEISLLDRGITECDELISIFVKTVETTRKNIRENKP
jgi:four helix bundle protein